jgi:signal transduction histidine kinase
VQRLKDRMVEVAKSPLNRRIIEGESFVTGTITEKEVFQFGEDLAIANVKSVQFAPLTVEDRVIGILGAYSRRAEQFNSEDVDFFRLAAGLAAIALENARAYKAVEDLMRERSWYMTRVAHNLRAPLAAMISIMDVVLGKYLGELNAGQTEYLGRVDRRARAAISMINELMVLAKSRSGKKEASKTMVSLTNVADKIRKTFQNEAAKKEMDFTLSVPDNLPMIQGDPEMLEQLMENLVSNAIKYTRPKGEVTVRFETSADGMVSIEVRDNGIGIPDEEKGKLFTEYFRGKNARATEEIGTGLGLPIIKEIVEQHGGKVRVESTEGQGTSFIVQLPIA